MSRGHFEQQAKDFVITDPYPVRPWYNFLWNRNFIAQVDQFGMGNSWHYSDAGVRSNHNCNGSQSDLCTITDNRLLFLRDAESGEYWAANRNYDRLPFQDFKSTVGQGLTTVCSCHRGLETRFELFIPSEGAAECWRIAITNRTETARAFSVFAYANSSIGSLPHAGCARGYFDPALNGLLLQSRCPEVKTPLTTSFFAADIKADAYETTNRRFRGVYGTISHPDAVANGQLSSQETNFDWQMISALQFNLNLAPGATWSVHILSGLAESAIAARTFVGDHLNARWFEQEKSAMLASQDARNSRFTLFTGDQRVDPLVNVWLKRQVSLGTQWGRVYGRGTRDILQDCTAAASFDPAGAVAGIVESLQHQLPDGNTLRQWNPVWDHPYRDGASWIVPAVTAYLKETGDFSFLDREVPYWKSEEKGTVLDHCKRGMDFLLNGLGEHGLCLWGGGDWNDSLNHVGLRGRGESVWLSQATVVSANLYAELLAHLGRDAEAASVRERTQPLKQNIRKHGWDGDRFLMGYNDDGEKLGSRDSEEGSLYLLPQAWGVLAGVADDGHALMDLVERELASPLGTALMKPAYSKGNPGIGLSSYMEKGCCENAAVYNHAIAFKMAADCALGRAEQAYRSLMRLLPGSPENPNSGVEPYVVVNQYLGPENICRAGDANGTWITGTAGWVYRVITEHMLGIRADYDGLKISPCLPKAWENAQVRRMYRGEMREIQFSDGQFC